MRVTLEWGALSYIVSDSQLLRDAIPGSLARRWEVEISHFRFLLVEDYKEIEARFMYPGFTIKAVPYYVSVEGLPPDVEECPGFYDL